MNALSPLGDYTVVNPPQDSDTLPLVDSPAHPAQRQAGSAALRSFFNPAATPTRRSRTVGGQIAMIVALAGLSWLVVFGIGLAITG